MEAKEPPMAHPHQVPTHPPPPYVPLGTTAVPIQPAGATIVTGPTLAFVGPSHVLGPNPCQLKCSSCQATVVTLITSSPGAMAWLIGLGLCAVGYVIIQLSQSKGLTNLYLSRLGCCACIPCCISDLRDVTHFCPNCHMLLGKYRGSC